MTPSTDPARDEAVADLAAIYEWLREPDYAEDFDIVSWANRRPVSRLVRVQNYFAAASAPAPASGVDAVAQAAEKVRVSRHRHGGTYESSPFEFYPVQEVDALLHAIDLGGKLECEECSGTGHTGIDGDEVYDCPACNGEGSLSPAATSGSEAGGGVLAGWCQPNGITKQAEYDIDQAIGGAYDLPDGLSFWLDHVAVKEIMRRAIPVIAAECERHRLVGGRTAKPTKKGGC